ncbi:hypothetical protein MTBLM5_210046 [Magnetospirillum sp. LM-5]|nr:hypothetical protein MTBLM5_210046 [Magnetospirillum sp. LM-5]
MVIGLVGVTSILPGRPEACINSASRSRSLMAYPLRWTVCRLAAPTPSRARLAFSSSNWSATRTHKMMLPASRARAKSAESGTAEISSRNSLAATPPTPAATSAASAAPTGPAARAIRPAATSGPSYLISPANATSASRQGLDWWPCTSSRESCDDSTDSAPRENPACSRAATAASKDSRLAKVPTTSRAVGAWVSLASMAGVLFLSFVKGHCAPTGSPCKGAACSFGWSCYGAAQLSVSLKDRPRDRFARGRRADPDDGPIPGHQAGQSRLPAVLSHGRFL